MICDTVLVYRIAAAGEGIVCLIWTCRAECPEVEYDVEITYLLNLRVAGDGIGILETIYFCYRFQIIL